MFFKNQKRGSYVLIIETRTSILYTAVNNINKAGCARTQRTNLFPITAEEESKVMCLENACKYFLLDTC